MKAIEHLFKEYLTTKTDYAFILNGKWGVGKTYFYKNTLEPNIKKIETYDDASKFYKPIYISMYGIRSIEDLQYEIFISFADDFISKKLIPSKNLISAISKGVLKYTGLSGLEDIASEIGKATLTKINLSDVVICFDDLERMHNDLNIEEFLGYINNLVEHQNTKILIIGNECEIKDNHYQIIKEKTIGINTYFKLNFDEVVKNIINNSFNKSKFNTYLQENISLIIEINSNDEINLRSLLFALKKFESIYYQILNSNDKVIKKHQSKILYDIYKFTLLISLEYRKGNINYNKTNGLDKAHYAYSMVLVNEFYGGKENIPPKKEKSTYSSRFIQAYYSSDAFYFYQSLFNYIVGIEVFQIDQFLYEFRENHYIEENEVTEYYKVFQSLSYPNFFELNDSQYINQLKEVLEYTKNGVYKIEHYLNIFWFIVRLNNPLNTNLDTLTETIIQGIEKAFNIGESKFVVNIDGNLNILETTPSTKEYQQKIISKIIEVNNRIWVNMKKEKALYFQNLLLKDIEQLTKEYIGSDRDIYLTNDSFKYMDVENIFKYYQKLNNSKKKEFNDFFKKKMYANKNSDEKVFFNALEDLIDKEIPNNKEIISKQLLLELKKTISVSV